MNFNGHELQQRLSQTWSEMRMMEKLDILSEKQIARIIKNINDRQRALMRKNNAKKRVPTRVKFARSS